MVSCGPAEDGYCANALGDWRVAACDESSSTPTTTAQNPVVDPTDPAPTDPDTTASPPAPETTTASVDTENIQIVNYHGSSEWYFAANLNGVSHGKCTYIVGCVCLCMTCCILCDYSGFAVSKFEIRKADNLWFECGQCAGSSSLYTCTVDSVIALPFSVRLSAAHTSGDITVITSNNAIAAFDHGVISDFGSNFAETPSTPTTTSAPAVSTERGGDQSITMTNRPSSTGWYYTVSGSSEVTSVEMRGNGQTAWQSGEYVSEFAGDYYRFEGSSEYILPLSFRVTALDGSVTTSYDLIDSFDTGVSATMVLSGAKPMRSSDGEINDDGSSAFDIKDYAWIIAVVIVVAVVIIGVFLWQRRMSRKVEVSIDNEITMENSVDPEAQIEQVDVETR